MALQSVAPVEDLADNEVERLIQTVFGKDWIKTGLGKLTPEQLGGASTLAGSTAESIMPQIAALGRVFGNMDKGVMESRDIHAIGWTIVHLAEYAEACRLIEMMADDLSNSEGRRWRLDGKLSDARGGAA